MNDRRYDIAHSQGFYQKIFMWGYAQYAGGAGGQGWPIRFAIFAWIRSICPI